jgi:hypothetical protein
MERFLARHSTRIAGTVSGFDRLLFRGTLRSISYVNGMDRFLASQRILYKDFAGFAGRLTTRLRTHAEEMAHQTGRPLEYLRSSSISKDARAREILTRDAIAEGLVCIFSCVESCLTLTVRGDRATKRLRLVREERRCVFLYFYYVDRDFGLMHVRLQTWLPLTVQVYVNGREWLARQLTAAGLAFDQCDNAVIPRDVTQTRAISDRLQAFAWEPWLTRYAARVNPWIGGPAGLFRGYYWSVRESEFATDVIFATPADLQAIYPRLLHHAIEHFTTGDLLRFLGRVVPGRFQGEAHSTLVHRPEGVRIRHWLDENSIKMYDKAERLLRVEMTLNNPDRFKVLRRRPSDRRLDWLPLRRGIADMRRRADLGRAAAARYLDALSVVGDPIPSHRLLDSVSHRVTRHGRPYRPLRPISPHEAPLFRTILHGEFTLQGFQNRDLRRQLYPQTEADPVQRRQVTARVTRSLRLLRAHGLIKKVTRTRYYRITDKGHHVMTTALRFRETDLALLAA